MPSNAVRATILAGSALAAGFLLPGSAAAGTARVLTDEANVRGEPVTREVISRLRFDARPGERNRVRVAVDAAAFTVTDRVPISAGRGCKPRARRVVRCPIVEKASTLTAKLADRTDSLTVTGPLTQSQDGGDIVVRVSGGAGHDNVVLGRRTEFPYSARLAGGPGNDRLDSPGPFNTFVGGPGNDTMLGGRGFDTFLEGTRRNGRDTMLGAKQFGGAADEVSYERRRGGVRADLDGRRDDGARGERDRIGRDIERLVGGSGSDRLAGDARRNDLFGGGGKDFLSGKAANDTVVGGEGSDRLSGGAGDDLLEGGGDARDTLSAGPGNDSLTVREGDSATAGPGFDVVSSRGGPSTIDLRDGGRDSLFCLGNEGVGEVRLDALDFFGSGPLLGGVCEQVDREGEALAVFRGSPGVSHFVGEAVALIDLGCPGDAAPVCSARVRIEMNGRVFDPVEYSGQRNSTELLKVPIDPAVVADLDSRREAFPAFVLVSARTPSGGTVERRHPVVIGAEHPGPGFGQSR